MTTVANGRLAQIFKKLDRDGDGTVSKAETEAHAKDAKVDSGLFGGKKLAGTVDQMMSTFDADKSGGISWQEFVDKSPTLIPEGDVEKLMKKRRGKKADEPIDEKELAQILEQTLEEQGVSMAGTKGEIGAKMAIATLDTNGDKKLSKAELTDLAADIAAQRLKARVG